MINKIIISIAIVCSILGVLHYVYSKFGIKDDNVVEQAVEQLIKDETGLDIDLTPESK